MRRIVKYFLVFFLSGAFLNPILAHENVEPLRVLEIGETVPNIDLIDQEESAFSLESVRGKVVMLSFIYTNCPDVCLLQTTKMRQTQDLLGDKFAKDVVFVSISFDSNDTPEILKEYALFNKADLSGWKFLGSQDEHEIKDTVESLGITYERDDDGLFSHSMIMYLLDKDLKVSKLYLGQFLDPNDVANNISELLPSSTDWTIPVIATIFSGIALVGVTVFLKRKKIILFKIFVLEYIIMKNVIAKDYASYRRH